MDYDDKTIELNNITLEDCEKMYNNGYIIIVDNGMLCGFKKENNSG